MPALPFPPGDRVSSIRRDAEQAALPANRAILFGDCTVTNNAVAVVGDTRSLTGNHGLTRATPLERYYRDVRCGRVHTPQDDATRINAGRLALGI
jgi:alkylation response protein AidB-like acyl-CoA dehydrogenase